MPKDPVAARQMKQQRLAKAAAVRNKIYGPSSRLTLHVVGNGGPGNPSCLYLVTDQHRYLFNCGEGTQRLCHEHGFKISKLEQIFITQPVWRNIGGLPGLCMTLQSIGVPTVNIHSPTDIVRLFEMTRLFNINNEMSVLQSTVEDKEFEDTTMKVTYLPFVKQSAKIRPENYKKRMELNSEDRNIVLSYICNLHPKPGALDIVKCMELGVPRGPLLGDLKNGKDVTLPDGTIIKSSDVTGSPEPGNIFIVIDCPSEEYLGSMLKNRDLLKHTIPEASEEDIPVCIIHFSPSNVIENERYLKWIHEMPPSVKHVLINQNNPLLAFLAAAELQEKLCLLDPEIFPHLVTSHEDESNGNSHIFSHLVNAPTFFTFEVRTPNAFEVDDNSLKFDPHNAKTLALSVEGFPEAVKDYQQKISSMQINRNNVYPIVTFFGTGSAIPGKDRNTSCIHISISENSAMVMDCAEQSYGQMLRFFGPEKIEEELLKIKCIFISHLHADHHLGLITLLKERQKVTNAPTFVIGPRAINEWLEDYSETYENVSYLYHFHESHNMLHAHNLPIDKMDLIALRTFRVEHCRDSFGITITTRGNINEIEEDPFKIVYSGDAMQSPQLVTAGQNCDLLIHEATMEDDLAEEARIKRHCTTSQAIEMGIRCRARNVILTHFSQRYAKIPVISDQLLDKCRNVSIAFDNMRIRRHDYDKLPLLHAPLKVLFNEYLEFSAKNLKKRELREQLLEEMKQSKVTKLSSSN